ncbi:salicylate hydroxylase [Ophiocordyceps camponoti-floridani]|uniref:Salicylate hydroxylase n=1 Tax=Ophiocordyceps camponoti-floridani TaxID=2030778 RepID=A0A8H4Q9N6_9HYPO|nr:salicylate hydroxylase [Ophiocordyceps camponoti-floridani]
MPPDVATLPLFASCRAPRCVRFVIAGAGIAGLATGLGLRLTGHDVTILDQASDLDEAGAGIQIAPNATRVLARLGVLDQVVKDADVLERISIRRYADDEELASVPVMPDVSHRYGAPALVMHRGDLYRILLTAARAAGCRILTRRRVVGIESGPPPRVQTEDGDWHEADIVLGADGVRSVMRAYVAGSDDTLGLKPTGDAAYRILIPRDRLARHKTLGALVNRRETIRWIGPSGHVMAYPIRHRALYNVVVLHSEPNLSVSSDDGQVRRAKADAVDLCRDWSRSVRDLVSCLPEGDVTEWFLYTHPPLSRWVRGRVALIGDACHPMLPYTAQGAACAIEDAGALVTAFAYGLPSSDAALALYERVRKPISETAQASTARQRTVLHLPDGIAQSRRDSAIRAAAAAPVLPNPDLWLDRGWQDRVWGYDVVGDTLRACAASWPLEYPCSDAVTETHL